METDTKQMFIMACAVELNQMIPINLSDLVNHIKLHEKIYMSIYDEWLNYCQTSNYKWGICGDTVVNDSFYNIIATVLTDGQFNSWPQYRWPQEEKEKFEKCLVAGIKNTFEYELKNTNFLF